METFGERVKGLLLKHQLLAKQVASELGVTSQSFARYTTTSAVPKLRTLQRLADAFTRAAGTSVAIDDLIDGVSGGASQKQQALSGPDTGEQDLGGAVEEAALPMSDAKFRHLAQIRSLTDNEFSSIEGDLKHLVARALQSFTPGVATAGPRAALSRKRRTS